MICRDYEFNNAECVVEIDRTTTEVPEQARFVAHLAVVEEDGGIVRPLVDETGKRVAIYASTEMRALGLALNYLEDRFGELRHEKYTCELGAAAIGVPFEAPPETWAHF